MAVDRMALKALQAEMERELGVTKDGTCMSGFFGDESTPMPDLVGFVTRADRQAPKLRERLLLDLANLSPDSRRLQKKMEWFKPETPGTLATAQKLLRIIWRRDVPLGTKQYVVDVLLVAATQRPGRTEPALYAPLPFGNLALGGKNFPGQLVMAILENWWRMAKCGNPECPVPYFLAKRSSQRYCERGDCTRYAVRQKALKWWRDNRGKPARKERKQR